MIKVRYYCDECLNEFEIIPINEPIEEEDELTPKVCSFCSNKVTDFYYDEFDPDD